MVVIGIDIGTQSTKVLVREGGRVLAEASSEYSFATPKPGWAEQEPALWEDALHRSLPKALAAAGKEPGEVASVAVAGQLDGCIAVNSAGVAISPCLIWMDRRATDFVGPYGDAERDATGLVFDASHMAAKAAWLRSSGVSENARFHQPTSYLVEKLCGAFVFDHALASTTMLYGLHARDFDEELLRRFGLSRGALPRIQESTSVAGRLHRDGAALTGLPEGVPVAVGTGDDFSTVLGAGITEPGPVLCGLGTAEVVGTLSDTPCIDRQTLVETHGFLGGYFVQNPGWQSGGALRWVRALLGIASDTELDALAAKAPAGCEGLVFLPALSGAMAPRWNADARGCFYGLTAHHGPEHLARAVFESCAFAMRDVRERLRAMGLGDGDLVLQGGGARSALWGQMRADVAQCRVQRQEQTGGSALGACRIAEAALGERSLATLCQDAPSKSLSHSPNAALAPVYDDAYERYQALFTALAPAFPTLRGRAR